MLIHGERRVLNAYVCHEYIYICIWIWIWIWKICIYMYIYRVKEGVNSKGNIIDIYIYIYVHIYIIPYLIPMGHITIWSLICIAILYDIVLVLQSPVYSWTGFPQVVLHLCRKNDTSFSDMFVSGEQTCIFIDSIYMSV